MEFESFYSEYYGERWRTLKPALAKEEQQFIRECFSSVQQEPFGTVEVATETSKSKLSLRNESGKLRFYAMDPASILAAKALVVSEGHRILDMCAAPGGKTLILMEQLGEGHLIANEISTPRRARLTKVIQQYLPDRLRQHIEVRGKDGIRYGMEQPGSFDGVLLDAPCSSERHLNDTGLREWSVSRSKRLAKKQFGLLSSAYLAVRRGGRIVYCTCSLSPFENDGVVERLVGRHSESLAVEFPSHLESVGAEITEYGVRFLPDHSGFGPIYFSVLKKR